MSDMNYRVGQVLFIIMHKKLQVYPMMVIEEITKRTLKGEEKNYVLQGGPDSETTILLNQVEGEIFDSPEEAKKMLITRATSQIERIVDSAVEKAIQWYQTNTSSEKVQKVDVPEQKEPPTDQEVETIKVHLPDGTIANLKNYSFTG
jgi:hypothetical protein